MQKCGNQRAMNQLHLQLAALLTYLMQPPPLGRVIPDAPSTIRFYCGRERYDASTIPDVRDANPRSKHR
jgi:hypothetical protein